jgi:hypothetical protein
MFMMVNPREPVAALPGKSLESCGKMLSGGVKNPADLGQGRGSRLIQ